MIWGLVAAVLAALAYGTASVLQARGAQRVAAGTDATGTDAAGTTPTLRSTLTAMITVSFLCGLVLDTTGFVGNIVAARGLPLFLAQPIVSANLVVTAVLATVVLGARLTGRDWAAIGVVVAALVVLGAGAGAEGHGHDRPWLHWTLLGVALGLFGLGLLAIRLVPSRVAVVAGLLGGTLFGLLSVAVRIIDGVSPFDLTAILTDPATYSMVVAGPGGFFMFTVALQTGSVSAAAASIVVGETVVPGAIGLLLLGDATRSGWGIATLVAFVAAVIGAVLVATSKAVATAEAA